jgi:mediator of RNA polymerase II transcription subunit 12
LDTKAGERLFTSNGSFIFIPIDTGPAPPDLSVAEKVIELTNDFSLPFCQLKLQLLFNAETKGDVRNEIVDVMFKAAVADSRSRRSNWVGLVRLMSHDAVRQVRYHDGSSIRFPD